MLTYTYHGIRYEYGDLQQARRRQNMLFHVALEKEDYHEASRIFDTDPREFLPQIYGSPERSEPEPAKPKRNKLFQVLSRLLR